MRVLSDVDQASPNAHRGSLVGQSPEPPRSGGPLRIIWITWPPIASNVLAMKPLGLGGPSLRPRHRPENPLLFSLHARNVRRYGNLRQSRYPRLPLHPTPMEKRKSRKKRWEWSGNAVIAGIVSAFVAGGISVLVTHIQDSDSARQATASQQVQAAQSLEADANSFYSYSMDIYNTERRLCASPNSTWRECASQALQMYQNYSPVMMTFAAAGSNVADSTAAQLANQVANAGTGLITASSAAGASKSWKDMVTVYLLLTERCGQLVQTQ